VVQEVVWDTFPSLSTERYVETISSTANQANMAREVVSMQIKHAIKEQFAYKIKLIAQMEVKDPVDATIQMNKIVTTERSVPSSSNIALRAFMEMAVAYHSATALKAKYVQSKLELLYPCIVLRAKMARAHVMKLEYALMASYASQMKVSVQE